jgi:hypothetical protein
VSERENTHKINRYIEVKKKKHNNKYILNHLPFYLALANLRDSIIIIISSSSSSSYNSSLLLFIFYK